jgi:hypothetical protein
MAFDDKDPLDVALDIKRHFARTAASREKRSFLDIGYGVGVVMWWIVICAAARVAGLGWLVACLAASVLCWFWPVVRAFERKSNAAD